MGEKEGTRHNVEAEIGRGTWREWPEDAVEMVSSAHVLQSMYQRNVYTEESEASMGL